GGDPGRHSRQCLDRACGAGTGERGGCLLRRDAHRSHSGAAPAGPGRSGDLLRRHHPGDPVLAPGPERHPGASERRCQRGNLVAWNRSYLDFFQYPDGLIHVGRPVADLVRFNSGRGLCGPGEIEEHVEKRITHMRNGTPHMFQRIMPDGLVVEMRGNPIPGGGFVTSSTDITEYVRSVDALAESKQSLEDRVRERTQTISEMNNELLTEVKRRRETEQELLAAKAEAEAANASKARFLALASH